MVIKGDTRSLDIDLHTTSTLGVARIGIQGFVMQRLRSFMALQGLAWFQQG